jgi:hypothetical protein
MPITAVARRSKLMSRGRRISWLPRGTKLSEK